MDEISKPQEISFGAAMADLLECALPLVRSEISQAWQNATRPAQETAYACSSYACKPDPASDRAYS